MSRPVPARRTARRRRTARPCRRRTGPAVAAALTLALLALPNPALHAQAPDAASSSTPVVPPTPLVVHVVSGDAKIIGSMVGGVHVLVREVATGRVLAEGVQEGGTGNTDLIMGPRERGMTVFDTEGAARFRAELAIDEPTMVEVVATGPLGSAEDAAAGLRPDTRRASTTLLVVPGHGMEGDGVVLTLRGFTVSLLEPAAPGFSLGAGESMAVRARITMLCGCPTEPGGLWDADRFTLLAQWVRDGRVLAETPLEFAGTTSEYRAQLLVPAEFAPGPVTVRVLAIDAERANTGMAEAPGRFH